jgi:hypothetical protein
LFLFVGWLLFYTIYYCIKYSHKFTAIVKPSDEPVWTTNLDKKIAPKSSLAIASKLTRKHYFGADVRIWIPKSIAPGAPV